MRGKEKGDEREGGRKEAHITENSMMDMSYVISSDIVGSTRQH